jgi:hypothetical protein
VERTTIAGETEVLGENLPQRQFVPPQIPHDQVRFRTPDRSGGKPATNRLSYGVALDGGYWAGEGSDSKELSRRTWDISRVFMAEIPVWERKEII